MYTRKWLVKGQNLENIPYLLLQQLKMVFGIVDLYSLNKINPLISRFYELVETGEKHNLFIGKSLYDYVKLKNILGIEQYFVTLVSAKHCQQSNEETIFTLKFPYEIEKSSEDESLDSDLEKAIQETMKEMEEKDLFNL